MYRRAQPLILNSLERLKELRYRISVQGDAPYEWQVNIYNVVLRPSRVDFDTYASGVTVVKAPKSAVSRASVFIYIAFTVNRNYGGAVGIVRCDFD
jgi:hypothetical protein